MTNKEKSIELLGEKCYVPSGGYKDYSKGRVYGYDLMHSKAVEVVEGLLERIDELEREIRRLKNVQ